MNSRELFLIGFLSLGILLTVTSFSKEKSFDCHQPMFGNGSTCSLEGQKCVLVQKKAGVTGVWSHLQHLLITPTERGFKLQCAPNCELEVKSPCKIADSVNQKQP